MNRELALGVDLGWVSQLESMGYSWVDAQGEKIDPIEACKQMGANAVRMRLFVDPPSDAYWKKSEEELCMLGFCDTDDVLGMAGRVKEAGMDLMLDFHYSDHFADPVIQDIPAGWADHSDEQLIADLAGYTKETLLRFAERDLAPRWVQVGNEVNNGIMWPKANLETAPGFLVRLLNAGYDAVKEVFPECQVITHLSAVNMESFCVPFLENFVKNGGKSDLFGFSYYPFWAKMESDADELFGWLTEYQEICKKPVLIAEVGAEDEKEETNFQTIRDAMDAVLRMPDESGAGVFYWEPDAHRSVVPDHYPLGACVPAGDKKLKFTKALTAYQK